MFLSRGLCSCSVCWLVGWFLQAAFECLWSLGVTAHDMDEILHGLLSNRGAFKPIEVTYTDCFSLLRWCYTILFHCIKPTALHLCLLPLANSSTVCHLCRPHPCIPRFNSKLPVDVKRTL